MRELSVEEIGLISGGGHYADVRDHCMDAAIRG